LYLVEEPALELSVSRVVVPDAQERERSEAALRAQDEVHDAARYQLLYHTNPSPVTSSEVLLSLVSGTRVSRTCYEDVTNLSEVAGVMRPCYEEVSDKL